jgi:hypothetical protein
MEPDDYLSFVLRLWREEPCGLWRSEVEHIQSGNRYSFASLAYALDFLRRAGDAATLTLRLDAGDGESPLDPA